jgi:hypothetical protein
MLYFVSFATTLLMSAEVIELEALVRFCDSSVSTVEAAWSCSTAAPSVPRSAETVEIAAVIAVRALPASAAELRSVEARERLVVPVSATVAPMLTVPAVVPSLVKAETLEPKIEVPLKLVELLMLLI